MSVYYTRSQAFDAAQSESMYGGIQTRRRRRYILYMNRNPCAKGIYIPRRERGFSVYICSTVTFFSKDRGIGKFRQSRARSMQIEFRNEVIYFYGAERGRSGFVGGI